MPLMLCYAQANRRCEKRRPRTGWKLGVGCGDGPHDVVEARGEAAMDEQGRVRRLRGTVLDTSLRHQMEDARTPADGRDRQPHRCGIDERD